MVDHNLLNELDGSPEALDQELAAVFGEDFDVDKLGGAMDELTEGSADGAILKGRVVSIVGDDVVVDVGLKSEGVIPKNEWDDPSEVDPGDEVEVWLEAVESDSGVIVISKRKADRLLNWQRIVATHKEGDDVKGKVMRKIKGGLLVDIGVPVFLPASQVDIRRPGDISEFIGREIHGKILKIDTDRRNIVISRRRLLEERRAAAKEKLFAEIEDGQVRRGTVKNLADFGAFVDLGGIDGLLHITDMSWDRVGHPSELLRIDDEIDVKVISVDKEKEKIALGLKQLRPNPWSEIEQKYPVGSKVRGEVVNITNYGAFVKLEPGVEGLVHISEMSWTRRISHPSEVISLGEEVEVVVLDITPEKEEISLGIKQTEVNPWTRVAERYPPNTIVEGRVRNMANYGAFVEIEEGIDGLLHVSDLSWTKKIGHPSEVLKKGEQIRCVVLAVDEEKQRISLGLKQLQEDPWLRAVPEKYIPGQIVTGKVTKITNFGVFIELEPDLEGLLHVSELADHKVDDPHDVVKIGDEIEVKILRVDAADRKIGLSKKRAEWAGAREEQRGEGAEKKIKVRRGGLHGPGDTSMLEDVVLRPSLREAKPPDSDVPREATAEPEPPEDAESDRPSGEAPGKEAEEPSAGGPADAPT